MRAVLTLHPLTLSDIAIVGVAAVPCLSFSLSPRYLDMREAHSLSVQWISREGGRRGNKRALSARITRLLEIARPSELESRLRDVGPVVPTLAPSPPASSYSFPCRPPRMTDQPNQTSQIHLPTFGGDNSSLFAITRKPRSEGERDAAKRGKTDWGSPTYRATPNKNSEHNSRSPPACRPEFEWAL